ncbi:MAG TPA: hypothetical protein VKU77_31715, partial [Streptosporangiaceae bacterium]|nr:hypothetical protein [Streptosporangiaceae bacterium]
QGGTAAATAAAGLANLGGAAVAGDIGGTSAAPQVTGTHLASPLPIAQGGTGTATGAPQNDVLAGPATGGAGAPSFRALAAADLPAASGAAQGAVQLAGDLAGTAVSPQVTGTHLAAPLPLAQGGTGQASQQAALNALAGAVAAGQYPRGNGTNVVMGPIQAPDLPAATTSSQGAVVLDGTAADIQPPGVQAAGAKGQAADAKHVHPYPAWVFQPEAYGAKRDGRFLYDVAMTSGSAVLTAGGLPAPSAPSVSNSGSGGTVLAGVYQIQVTYVNQYGETLGSTASSTTTSGTTSVITVTSPLPWTNATGYYVYCTQAGGSSFTRQQAPGSPTPLRASYVISAPPSGSGAAPGGANTSGSAPFTSADVGKHILVPSAGGFLNVPLVTTIASYQSPTQVTLAASATRTVTGSGAVYGTDDTAAIQSAVGAAVAYAQAAEQGIGEVRFSTGIYCAAGSPGGPYQSAQIQLPYVDPYAGPRVSLALTGPHPSTGPAHWEQPNPLAGGATLASLYYNDSAGGAGPPPNVVIGAPVQGGGLFFGGSNGLFSNMRVTVDGINILAAYRPCVAGLDLYGAAQADIRSYSYSCLARTGTAAGGWPPYESDGGNPSAWGTFGYRTPAAGNNDQNDLGRATILGPYHGVIFSDHFAAQSIRSIFCNDGVLASSVTQSHHCEIGSLSFETGQDAVRVDSSGQTCALFIGSLHAELLSGFYINDPGNLLYGEIRAENLSATGIIANGKNGAANVRLVWDYQPLGAVASPPAVPASTTGYTNQFWRDAVVIVSGGTVTAIAVDGKNTGLTSGPVFVRNGGTITLTYSAAPAWNWVII